MSRFYDNFYFDYNGTELDREQSDSDFANALVESYTGYPSYKHTGVNPKDCGW